MSYNAEGFGQASGENIFTRLLGGDSGFTAKLSSSVYPNTISTRKGVHANYPVMTPKYSTGNGERSIQSMARLLIPLAQREVKDFLDSFTSPDAQQLSRALATTGSTTDSMGLGFGYLDFLLGQAQEQFQEKVQVVDVLSDNYVAYFFGSAPPMFSYSGTLFNSRQDDWRTAFTIMYLEILRGTQLARRGKVVTLAYDDHAVTGALVSMSQVLTAEMQLASTFSFQLLVQRIDISRTLGHKATQAPALPYSVNTGELASLGQVVTRTPPTIRTVNMPTYQTKQPVAPKDEGVQPSFDTESYINDVSPAPISTPSS